MLRDSGSRDQAFTILSNRYGERLYWHIRRIVVGHADAEDVLQDTMLHILTSIDSFRGGSEQLCPWLYRIATNEALMFLRGRTHIFESIDALSDELVNTLVTENPMQEDTIELALQKAVLQLPTTQRLVFNLRYYDDLSYEEIGTITGKRVGTLKTNYHYAVDYIKQQIKDIEL